MIYHLKPPREGPAQIFSIPVHYGITILVVRNVSFWQVKEGIHHQNNHKDLQNVQRKNPPQNLKTEGLNLYDFQQLLKRQSILKPKYFKFFWFSSYTPQFTQLFTQIQKTRENKIYKLTNIFSFMSFVKTTIVLY